MSASVAAKNLMLDTLLRDRYPALYLSIHRTNGAELAGGGYQRRPVRFNAAQEGYTTNTEAIEFGGLLPGEAASFGVWATPVGATDLVWEGPLLVSEPNGKGQLQLVPRTRTLEYGDVIRFDQGTLILGFDGE